MTQRRRQTQTVSRYRWTHSTATNFYHQRQNTVHIISVNNYTVEKNPITWNHIEPAFARFVQKCHDTLKWPLTFTAVSVQSRVHGSSSREIQRGAERRHLLKRKCWATAPWLKKIKKIINPSPSAVFHLNINQFSSPQCLNPVLERGIQITGDAEFWCRLRSAPSSLTLDIDKKKKTKKKDKISRKRLDLTDLSAKGVLTFQCSAFGRGWGRAETNRDSFRFSPVARALDFDRRLAVWHRGVCGQWPVVCQVQREVWAGVARVRVDRKVRQAPFRRRFSVKRLEIRAWK